MTVKTILDEKGREVVSVPKATTLAEAAGILADRRIGAIVIADARGGLQGILSERDIVRAVARSGGTALDRPVSEFMTSKVVRCSEAHTVNQVMEMMTEGRFRHLPVDSGGVVVGIISIGDVVRHRIEEVEREAAEMKAYIAS